MKYWDIDTIGDIKVCRYAW